MLGVFNRTKFIDLLKKAMGNRTTYAFAKEIDVSKNNLGLILKGKAPNPPRISTIEKIASKATNGVTFDDLMMAAGLMPDEEETKKIAELLEKGENQFSVRPLNQVIPDQCDPEVQHLVKDIAVCMEEKQITPDELMELLDIIRTIKKRAP